MDTDNENNIDNRLIALDLECSLGGYPHEWRGRGDVLSIGMIHVGTGEEYYQEVQWKDVTISSEAGRVHGLDLLSLDQRDEGLRLPVEQVDKEARAWVEEVTGIQKQWKIRAVGFGVKHFDLPYLQYCRNPMMRIRDMFSLKAFELTDICEFLDVCEGLGMGTIKPRIKNYVNANHTHHALDDARQAAQVCLTLKDMVSIERFW